MGIEEIRSKVQRMLIEQLGSVRVGADGYFLLENESAEGWVSVVDWGDGDFIVKVVSPLLRDVELTHELFEWVAVDGQCKWFAHARIIRNDQKPTHGLLLWEYDLLGNYLDADELAYTVRAVMIGSNDLDDDLQKRFGGLRGRD